MFPKNYGGNVGNLNPKIFKNPNSRIYEDLQSMKIPSSKNPVNHLTGDGYFVTSGLFCPKSEITE